MSRHGGYDGGGGCIPRRLQLLLKAAAARDRNGYTCAVWALGKLSTLHDIVWAKIYGSGTCGHIHITRLVI